VLLVSKLRAGGHLYYLAPTGSPDRPGVERPGRWVGRGAERLELAGAVDPASLEAVLCARHPLTGDQLGAGPGRVSITAFDLTFCAPKSVSLLHALGPDEVTDAVRAGHEEAVRTALDYVEGHALAVRRMEPAVGRVPVPVEPLPAAAFLHRCSRDLDPHLHEHVLIPNVGRGPEGEWSALDGRGVYAHRAATEAVYHAQLRYELTRALGVAWGPLDRGRADICGIEAPVREEFSGRSAAIVFNLAEHGLLDGRAARSARAAEVAALATRAPKDLEVTHEELRPWWAERARCVGLGPRHLEAVLDRVPKRALSVRHESLADARPFEASLVAAIADAVQAQYPEEWPFARRHVVRAWAASRPLGEQGAVIEEGVDRFLVSSYVADAGGATGRQWTDGPGVAERHHRLEGRTLSEELDGGAWLQRDTERRQLEQMLARRGLPSGPEQERSRIRSVDRGEEVGLELGW